MINNDTKLKPAKRRIIRVGIMAMPTSMLILSITLTDVLIDLLFGNVTNASFFLFFIYVGISIIIAIISMLISLLIWKNEFIYIEDNNITYEMTFLVKRKVGVPLENINVIKTRRTFWDLLLKTTTIKIDSGTQVRSQQTELTLCFEKEFAFKYANYLRAYSKALKEKQEFDNSEYLDTLDTQSNEDTNKDNVVFKMTKKDKFRYAFTSVGIMTTLFTFIGMLILSTLFYRWLYNLDIHLRAGLLFMLLLLIIVTSITLISTLIAFISVFTRYYNYTITKQNDGISIEYGLFTKKNLFVPYDKIHGYSVRSNIIQQIFSIGTIRLSVIGIDTEQSATFLFLAASKVKKEAIINTFLSEFNHETPLTKSNKKSFIHTVLVPTLIAVSIYVLIFLTLALIIILTDIGYTDYDYEHDTSFMLADFIVIILVLLIPFIRGLLILKNAGFSINDKVITTSCGALYKRHTITKTKSVQDIKSWQGPLRRKHNVATYYVFYQGSSIMGGNKVRNIPVIDLKEFK